MTSVEASKELLALAFRASVRAAHPDAFFAQDHIRQALVDAAEKCSGRILVLGAGKAAAAMAAAVERVWGSSFSGKLEGLVATQAGYEVPTSNIEVAIGAHPMPEETSVETAGRMLDFAKSLTSGDLLIGLWSGGGSALLASPVAGLSFGKYRALTKGLLASGADIHEINTIRKHLSEIAGGRLAQAANPAQLLNFYIPDVVSDDEAVLMSAIASGPCAPDPTSCDQAISILSKYRLDANDEVTTFLNHRTSETASSWEELHLSSSANHFMAPDVAVEHLAKMFQARNYALAKVQADVTGEAREVALTHAHLAKSLAKIGQKAVIITGGELTVNVTGNGSGGPNQEYALALAIALEGVPGVSALSADTDGIDGFGEAAGAFVLPDTLARMSHAGIDPGSALLNNDAGTAFAAIDDLLITGPTFTNVNDLRLIVING